MKYRVRKNDNIEFYIQKTDDVKSGGTKYAIIRSEGECWMEHAKGEFIFSVIDDGNNIILDKKIKKLDYSFYIELLLLLNFIKSCDKRFGEYFIEEVINEISI